jgi:hypothetical protein
MSIGCFRASLVAAAVLLRRVKDEMSSPEMRISLVDGEKKSFVASLLWMTAKNGLGGGTKRLGEADDSAAV